MDAPSTTTHVYFSSKPKYLQVKFPERNNVLERVSLQELVRIKCSSLHKPFYPSRWLRNGHLQTLYNVFGNFSHVDQLWYRRQLLNITDGGTIGLDFAPVNFGEMEDNTPILVVAHGLTGGSYESYLRAIVAPAVTPIKEVVITYRGCSGIPLTSPKLYTAGHTDDFRLCLAYIQHLYPRARLLGVGFSLGANIMTRYLAEEGRNSRLCSAVSLACPWNLESNGQGLTNSFLGKHIYSRGMGTNLQSIVRKHEKALRQFPNNPIYKELDATLTLRFPTLQLFDDTFTRKVCGETPLFPMPTANHYYQWASTHHLLSEITVPYLSINAEDDPVVKMIPKDGGKNGSVVIALTQGGGHLGWFESVTWWRRERWTTKPVLEWLKLMGEEVMLGDTIRILQFRVPAYPDYSSLEQLLR
ncbi:AB-hydrolase YheT [Cyathus striatus]|nr:AB-hydrolase YheT [Cyathus striatus]